MLFVRTAAILVGMGLGGTIIGCTSPVETEPDASPATFAAYSVLDAAHDGVDHFFFLPPLVEQPDIEGSFDPDRSPTVSICALDEASCVATIAEFTLEEGAGSETVRVDTDSEHYLVNWHTDRFELDDDGVYRIRVLLEGLEVGHADVRMVTGGNELRNAATDEAIPLLDGRTLPIRFRIEDDLQVGPPVPEEAPDTVPGWFYADDNVRGGTACSSGRMLRGIVALKFESGATRAERSRAVGSVDGIVVGGVSSGVGEGYYYVQVEDDPEGRILCDAIDSLNALSFVALAHASHLVQTFYRRADDDGAWADEEWRVDLDAVEDSPRWGLEAIAAPHAWACDTGLDGTAVAVVDEGFHSTATDLMENVPEEWRGSMDVLNTTDHGTRVASILAARGDNESGITGTMWRSGLRPYDTRVITEEGIGSSLESVVERIKEAAEDGARVVNASMGIGWQESLGRLPETVPDSVDQDHERVREFRSALLTALADVPNSPLIVLAAGNDGVDAYWAGFPAAGDALGHRDQIVTVSAGTLEGGLAPTSNRGGLVEIAAPGASVGTLDGSGVPRRVSGSSFAAPYASGVGGLLASFDPTLTAAELKEVIVGGAIRGGRSVDGTPLLNAYESLRVAAERDGAPLCGNRVWSEGGELVAQRERAADTRELLHVFDEDIHGVDVRHGGRWIRVRGADSGDRFSLVYRSDSRSWDPVADAAVNLPGGTARSRLGLSHEGDSLAVVSRRLSPGRAAFDVRIRDIEGTGDPIASIEVDLARSVSSTCMYIDFEDDECRRVAGTGVRQSAWSRQAYAPIGDRILVAINVEESRTTFVTSYLDCPFASEDAPLGCRRVGEEMVPLRSVLYEVEIETGAVTQIGSIPDRYVFHFGLSEDGREFLSGEGYRRRPSVTEPSEEFPTFTTRVLPDEYEACRVTFRHAASGAVIGPSASSDRVCDEQDFTATIAPSVVAETSPRPGAE